MGERTLSKGNTLSFNGLEKDDLGEYSCVATNNIGSTNAIINFYEYNNEIRYSFAQYTKKIIFETIGKRTTRSVIDDDPHFGDDGLITRGSLSLHFPIGFTSFLSFNNPFEINCTSKGRCIELKIETNLTWYILFKILMEG